MTTSVNRETQPTATPGRVEQAKFSLTHFFQRSFVYEVVAFLSFCLFTAILTWPYVTRLRDVVVDKGDPYLISWIMWWDYHQTFTDPLHLFNANIFYPLKYTLAFSEHSYGIAMLFFPLYALGLRPLTVHAIAEFFAFALNGYCAFRLGRTLTGSAKVGWVTGIVYAFVPFRYNMMAQVAYLFSPWIPLVFEALVLFVRERTNKRAAWLGFAFFMNGLTAITWFNFILIPFALYSAILLTRHQLWRDRDFWFRGAVSLFIAMLALLPFMIPYAIASRIYNMKRSIEEIKLNSAMPVHWLSAENRNKLWNRMGEGVFEGYKFKLFPGLLPILFSVAALVLRDKPEQRQSTTGRYEKLLPLLDGVIVVLFAVSILAIGFDHSTAFHKFFDTVTSERALSLLTLASFVRICIAYPAFLNTVRPNLIETIRSSQRSDAFWLGSLLTVIGFCFSLGWNFFFFRICYELIPLFRSMRVVTRGSVLAYLGLGILAGLGVRRLAEWTGVRYPTMHEGRVFTVACLLLLFELNAAPLAIVRGDVLPDAVTLKLKNTSMRGGIAHLPAGGQSNYRYMLRAADHQKPLVVGTSGFNTYQEDKIESLSGNGAIPDELMTLFEKVPSSYLVVANQSIPLERAPDYQAFLGRQLTSGRLRFINRFDGHDDLYAVVKNEPQARSEAALPFDLSVKDWAGRIQDEPVILLGQPLDVSQKLYRAYVASFGDIPRYKEFKSDLENICRGVIVGSEGQTEQLNANFQSFINELTKRESFLKRFVNLNDEQFLDQLIQNAGISVATMDRQKLVSEVATQPDVRTSLLLKVIDEPQFVAKEQKRSLVALHYFAYLRRNPNDPPDNDWRGFNFWVNDIEHNSDPNKLRAAFSLTDEYQKFFKKP